MRLNLSKLIVSIGFFALVACDSSSAKNSSDAAQPITNSPNAAGTSATSENAGGATTATAAAGTTKSSGVSGTGGAANKANDAAVATGKAGKGADPTVKDQNKNKDAAVTANKDAAVAGKQPTAEEKKLIEMYEDEVNTFATTDIDPLYEKLDALPSEFLIGTWKGGVFQANAANPQNWYGKRVFDNLTAEAWVTNNPDGSPGANDLIMGGGGLATIRQEEFKGKTSAVLVYATGGVKDYFRKIRGDYSKPALGDIVIGYSTWNSSYFHLTRTFLSAE